MAASSSSSNWGFAVLLLLSLSLPRGFSLTCTSQKFSANNVFSHCADLPVLAAYLHWTYDASNSSLSIAFLAPPPRPGGWVAWAINPTDTGMVGSQTLVAYQPAGGAPTVETYNVASYGDIKPAKLSFEVWDMAAEFSGGVMRIFAKLKVPVKTTVLNQVWQVGPSVDGTILAKHDFLPANLNARGTVSLSDGDVKTPAATGVDRRTLKKNIHGVLNVVSWGLLFPIGIVIARYMRVFPSADPAWFYLHISCQISAYVIGVAGWGTGMKLGSESVGYEVSDHRNIGIALFSMATVQMFALFLRPKKDHKYRLFWNIYHHTVGYTILILGIVNVFKGFDILNPDRKWKSAYIVAVAVVGAVAGVLEAITWVVVLKRKRSGNGSKRYDGEAREQFGS